VDANTKIEILFGGIKSIHFSAGASKVQANLPGAGPGSPESARMESKKSSLESSTSSPSQPRRPERPGWLKLGVVTAASALAGGVAAAWWYRKTLEKLRQSPEIDENPDFRILDGDPDSNSPKFTGEGQD
jgi:hypothetical protein